jgi:hypothetical protein
MSINFLDPATPVALKCRAAYDFLQSGEPDDSPEGTIVLAWLHSGTNSAELDFWLNLGEGADLVAAQTQSEIDLYETA